MKATKFATYLLQILIVGMLLLAFLPVMPATAADPTVIGVSISEAFTRQDTYQPADPNTNGVQVIGNTLGSGTITITNRAGVLLNNVQLQFATGNTQGWAVVAADNAVIPYSVTAGGLVTIQTFPVGGTVHVTYTPQTNYVPPVTMTALYSQNSVTNALTSSSIIHLTATLNTAGLPADVTAITPTINIASADNAARGTVGLADWTLSQATWSPALSTTTTSLTQDITATVHDVPALTDPAGGATVQPLATSTTTYTITSSQRSGSGISLTSATATTPQVQSDITKQFTGGNWVFTPKVSVTGPLTYTLTSVTEWAVDSSALSTTLVVGGTTESKTFAPNVDITSATPWTGSGAQILQFPYNGIPVGFMKPTIALKNTLAQFGMMTNGDQTQATVTLVKSIYVINGYQVEVVKTITSPSAGHYHINIVATNMGTAATPPNVFVYDIVPAAFYNAGLPSPSNIQLNGGASAPPHQLLTSGPNSGDQAYWWNVGTLNPHLSAGDHATVDYDVTGAGVYDATNLYVVGVDPAQSVNLQTTPVLSNMSTMATANFETLAALGAAGLLIVGMVGSYRRRM